jgi:molybdate transport system substrate-binding protein
MFRSVPRVVLLFVAAVALLAGGGLLFGAGAPPAGPARTKLTVSAAISLKDALDEAKQHYTKDHPDVAIAINYGASGTLQLQIEQGAPVDVFVSAAPKQMDALEMKGLLLAGTRTDLVQNEVVLVVAKDSKLGLAGFMDLTRPDVKQVALGEPASVPAGEYAKETLTSLGIYDAVKAKAILAKDVRQVLTYVESGNVDAGIVYATDAMSSARVMVAATAPPKSHSLVIYPGAVVKATANPEAAKAFLDFLAGPRGAAVFRKYGFKVPGP